MLMTEQAGWNLLGTFDSNTTTPDVNNRTTALVLADANNAIYTIPPEWNCIILRCATHKIVDLNDINDVNTVVDVLYQRGTTDSFSRLATLTFTAGTQLWTTDPNYLFADTVVESNYIWPPVPTTRTISPANNYIAEWFVDIRGAKKIAIVPITITRTRTAKIEITGY